jgi:hypothetical protein
MKSTFILSAALLLAAPSFAQTVTELLEQGIYAQETSGDLDEAVKIYRQVVSSASGQHAIAAQAQYRLASTLLQKGDVANAAAEYRKLARDFPDQTKLVQGSKLAVALQRTGAIPAPSAEPAGVVQGSHYHHNLTGVEFDLPPGWSIGTTRPVDGDPHTMTVLVDPDSRTIFASVSMSKLDTPQASIAGALSRAVPQLLARRAGTGSAPHGVANYKIQDGSERQTSIGGNQAVQAVGEYELGGQKISELLTWIFTDHTRTYFFAKMASDDLPAVQPQFEQLLQSARIP